ncbi:unnamed protein product [Angiostrongylus costaricensis]|uniref:Uncharacterized protein n=1 Tax=Angiostrongylus costaricensis TaxID=334426 RepID=A0A0R3PZ60_ANGCS|nr:unnamed protein product [Angiostrongylus costaricensis]
MTLIFAFLALIMFVNYRSKNFCDKYTPKKKKGKKGKKGKKDDTTTGGKSTKGDTSSKSAMSGTSATGTSGTVGGGTPGDGATGETCASIMFCGTFRGSEQLRIFQTRTRLLNSIAERPVVKGTGPIKFHVIALQGTKSKKTDMPLLNDGTLVIRELKFSLRNVGDVGLVVHSYILIWSPYAESYQRA